MLDILRMALDVAVREGAAFSNVARHDSITRPAQRPKALTLPRRSDFPALVSQMRAIGGNAKHAADLVEFLAYSGARKSKAADVLRRDVNFQRNTVLLRKTKNGYPRVIPLITELRRLLNCLKESRPFDTPDSPVMVARSSKSIEGAAKKAGVPRLTHHDLGHLFATTLIEHGIDIPTVAQLLGHRDGGALESRFISRCEAHKPTNSQEIVQ